MTKFESGKMCEIYLRNFSSPTSNNLDNEDRNIIERYGRRLIKDKGK